MKSSALGNIFYVELSKNQSNWYDMGIETNKQINNDSSVTEY